jgi:hypothetical protein
MAIKHQSPGELQSHLDFLKGSYAAKYILRIMLEDDSRKTDEWIKSVLEMLP